MCLILRQRSQDRTFNSLDGADREVVVEIEIDSTNGGLSVGCDLPLDCGRASEVFLDGSMEPPLLAAPDQRGTAQLGVSGQIPTRETHLEPGPACSRPDFEQDTRWGCALSTGPHRKEPTCSRCEEGPEGAR